MLNKILTFAHVTDEEAKTNKMNQIVSVGKYLGSDRQLIKSQLAYSFQAAQHRSAAIDKGKYATV